MISALRGPTQHGRTEEQTHTTTTTLVSRYTVLYTLGFGDWERQALETKEKRLLFDQVWKMIQIQIQDPRV
jgi:hypothetical protein